VLAGLRRTKTLETIAFWGFGEPLTHPDIAEMIRLAKERGLRAEMVTNGLLLDRPTAESLLDTGLDLLVAPGRRLARERIGSFAGKDLEAILANIRRCRR
jgi:pyruvate-formate lyase-activating enzyme